MSVHEAWEDTVTLSVPAIYRLLDERVQKETPNAAEALRFFVRQMLVKAQDQPPQNGHDATVAEGRQ